MPERKKISNSNTNYSQRNVHTEKWGACFKEKTNVRPDSLETMAHYKYLLTYLLNCLNVLLLHKCITVWGRLCSASSSSSSSYTVINCFPSPSIWNELPRRSSILAQEDCARLTVVRFSSVGRGRTKPSVQLDLESRTIICWRTSYSRTCHTAVSDSRWRCFH